MTNLDKLIGHWSDYFGRINNWQQVVAGITPIATSCGPVYELPPRADRPDESWAIADMRALPFAAPHYHTNETEIYFVLSGTGTVVVGEEEIPVTKNSIVVILPDRAHFTIPGDDLVLGVVNTPPFKPENSRDLTASSLAACFDREQFLRLTNQKEEHA